MTPVLTPVPDGVRRNHFRNEKGRYLHRTTISCVISLPPCLYFALAKWIFNDPIMLHWLFLEIFNYNASHVKMMHSLLTQCLSKCFVKQLDDLQTN